jgi:hypothetical protein
MEKKFGKDARVELEANGVDWTSLPVGNEEKYNHATCPAGVDRKRRLYVINKGGAYLYKCFNCGGSGHFRNSEHWSPITTRPPDTLEGGFDKMFRSTKHLPEEATLWLLHYEIDPDEFPAVFGASGGHLQIAVYNGDALRGFQRRYFNGTVKYSTRVRPYTYYHYLIGKEHPDVVFVVEDLLSSYKIWSLGYSVVALLGTSLKGAWPAELTNPKQVVVWLDNDTAGHVGAAKFIKEMTALFPHKLNAVFDRQPKEVPYVELTSLCEAFNG